MLRRRQLGQLGLESPLHGSVSSARDRLRNVGPITLHGRQVGEESAIFHYFAVPRSSKPGLRIPIPSISYSTFQVILLEEGWADLFLLSVFQWSMPMEACPVLAAPLFPELGSAGGVKPSDIRYLQDLFVRFRAYAIDPAEFACLKAIVLFRPGTNCCVSWLPQESIRSRRFEFLTPHGSALPAPMRFRF